MHLGALLALMILGAAKVVEVVAAIVMLLLLGEKTLFFRKHLKKYVISFITFYVSYFIF